MIFIRVPYYIGDLKRESNLENHPYRGFRKAAGPANLSSRLFVPQEKPRNKKGALFWFKGLYQGT